MSPRTEGDPHPQKLHQGEVLLLLEAESAFAELIDIRVES